MPRAAPKALPPDEAALVRRLQDAVRDCTLSEPAEVRGAVVRALAAMQKTPSEAQRIASGQLHASERRVVRTVTNRGAAVRSRLRQRKELARLRAELREKDRRVAALEEALRKAGTSHRGAGSHSQAQGGAGGSSASAAPGQQGSRSSFEFNAFIDSLVSRS